MMLSRNFNVPASLIPAPFSEQLVDAVLGCPAKLGLNAAQQLQRRSSLGRLGETLATDEQWLKRVDPDGAAWTAQRDAYNFAAVKPDFALDRTI